MVMENACQILYTATAFMTALTTQMKKTAHMIPASNQTTSSVLKTHLALKSLIFVTGLMIAIMEKMKANAQSVSPKC